MLLDMQSMFGRDFYWGQSWPEAMFSRENLETKDSDLILLYPTDLQKFPIGLAQTEPRGLGPYIMNPYVIWVNQQVEKGGELIWKE